ncbi:MAG: Recombination protein RecR [Parcubacteria group bacterium GW2011_GWC2_45_7]|nr:MAG: Recombination protein RecR [Parcubacteria group bacterium GW2011_GWC2_45_7]KKU73955.1 MAG: Recombination protein RecR [Parcubacteria group bacterium GW2011_GWA2_47_26]
MNFPPPITRLIQHFRGLPGVGPRTATRFVFALLNKSEDELRAFGHTLVDFKHSIRTCKECFNISLQDPCEICSNQKRERTLLCIVARPQDIQAIEETREYNGLYHVLGGVLNPIDGVTPEQLRIKELLTRLEGEQKFQEIILALNLDIEGEATALYLAKLLKSRVPKVTRLARGLPQGADLEYADEVTLINALKGRRDI